MRPRCLVVVPVVLIALAGGPLPARAASTDCIQGSEMALGGIPLGASRHEVIERLGKPTGRWEERLDRHLDHLVYPGLDVQINAEDKVEGLVARSDRYSTPSGARVGMLPEEAEPKLGLLAPFSEAKAGFLGPVTCDPLYGKVYLVLGYNREGRLAQIAMRSIPEVDQTLIEYAAEKSCEAFDWTKGPLAYLAMLRKHRRRAHKVVGMAPPGWVKESDLPALFALVKDQRICAATQPSTSPVATRTHSTVGREARYLIEAFRRGEFPVGSGSVFDAPEESELREWWDEWRRSRPTHP